MTKKRVQVDGNNLDATYTYNNEGRVATVQHPSAHNDTGWTYTYSFDSMGRPYSLVDNEPTPYHWVNSVTYGPADEEQRMNTNVTRLYNSMLQMTWDGIRTYYYSTTQNNGSARSKATGLDFVNAVPFPARKTDRDSRAVCRLCYRVGGGRPRSRV